MKIKSYIAAISLAGAALLSWRVGDAIIAEIGANDARLEEPLRLSFTFGIFTAGAIIPVALIWSVVSFASRPDKINAVRLAVTAAIGLYFLVPALLHVCGAHTTGSSSLFPWAVIAFLSYRYLLCPAAIRAIQ